MSKNYSVCYKTDPYNKFYRNPVCECGYTSEESKKRKDQLDDMLKHNEIIIYEHSRYTPMAYNKLQLRDIYGNMPGSELVFRNTSMYF